MFRACCPNVHHNNLVFKVTDLVVSVLMMSEEASQIAIWSYRVNLDKRIRSDHPLRRINEVLVDSAEKPRFLKVMIGRD
jgi:hypothetical protein